MVTPFGASKRTSALDEDYRQALLALLHKSLLERWSVRRAFWNKSVVELVTLLLDYGDFAFGKRIALSYSTLEQLLRRPPRSIALLLQRCDEIHELIGLTRFACGETGSDGQVSPGHAEFELGPVLRALNGKAPERGPLPPRRGRPLAGHEPGGNEGRFIRMPPEYLNLLKQFAAANKTSLGGAVVVLLEEHRRKNEHSVLPLAQ